MIYVIDGEYYALEREQKVIVVDTGDRNNVTIRTHKVERVNKAPIVGVRAIAAQLMAVMLENRNYENVTIDNLDVVANKQVKYTAAEDTQIRLWIASVGENHLYLCAKYAGLEFSKAIYSIGYNALSTAFEDIEEQLP